MIYDVTGTVEYPGGRGRLMRSREGIVVRGPSSKHANALRLAGVATLGLFGVLAIGLSERPTASCELQLPDGGADREPPGAQQRMETLWELDVCLAQSDSAAIIAAASAAMRRRAWSPAPCSSTQRCARSYHPRAVSRCPCCQ